jgi:hypothetical protein
MRRVTLLTAVLVIALAACGSDEGADPASTSVTTEPTGATTEVTSADSDAPTTTVAATTTPPTTAAPTTAAPVTEPPATEPPVTDAPTTTLPPFPPFLAELPDPPDVWSVVLAGSADFDDPVLDQAIADAAAAGYDVGKTDCDEGAAEAIGMDGSGVYTITIYLNSEADANAAAEAFAARGVDATVALVTLFCLD